MADEPKYLNILQAAEALGVNRRRIRELIAAGELEAVSNPLDKRERLIPRTAVERLAEYTKKAVA